MTTLSAALGAGSWSRCLRIGYVPIIPVLLIDRLSPVSCHVRSRSCDAEAALGEVSEIWDAYRSSTTATFEARIDPAVCVLEYVARIPVEPPADEIERRLRAIVADGRSAFDNVVYVIGTGEGLTES